MRDPFFLAKLRAFILGLRPRKIRRRLLEARARRAVRRQRRALHVPSPLFFVLEPLEGRMLLSADFAGAVDLLNHPVLPSEAPAVGHALVATIQSHHDSGQNGSPLGFIGSSWGSWHHGDRPGSPESVTVHDPDGTKATFTVTGPGHEQGGRDGNTWDVALTGTDARSIFTTKTSGSHGGHHAPLSLEAHLAHDTGVSASDGITSNPTIAGTLEHSRGVKSFKAGFDDTPTRDFVSIKGELGPDGHFVLDRADLARINADSCGAPLADGTHTLHLIATDTKGHSIERDVTFTLDTRPPKRPTVDLAPEFDSAPVGDHRTTFDVVTLVGRTSPGAFVALVGTQAATTADQNGRFAFEDVSLDVGRNLFKFKATDLAGNRSFGSVRITRIAAALPTLAIDDVTVTEGNAGTTNAVFMVSLSAASAQQVTVGFATADDTASAGADYDATSGALTFAAGTTAQQITVPVIGDLLDEPPERFFVRLSGATNATIADGEGVGTITDDDAAPSVAIDDVTVTEGNAGITNAVFTVSLSAVSGQTVSVDFATADGTAAAPGDYAAQAGRLTFAPGATTQHITVGVAGDTTFEPTESFLVNLAAAVNATIADDQGIGTIANDDARPTLAISDAAVREGDAGTTGAVFTVSLSGASSQTITADFVTADQTAHAPADYATGTGTVSFAPGVTTQLVTVAVVGDRTFESDETFLVTLTNPVNTTIVDGEALGTIVNDDTAPVLAINDVTVTEGNTGTTNAIFTVTLTGATELPTVVGFGTADGTALAGSDYTATSGTLGFAPGTTVQQVTVAVLGDTVAEPVETFNVNLSAAFNASIGDAHGVGTILDDDATPPTVSVNDVTVAEGNAGTTSAVFTVSLSAAGAQQITVGYATADGTATTQDNDYASAAGTLTFAPGVTAQQLTVAVVGDAKFEANETFLVSLSNPVNATLADATGVGTITNDDAPPTLAVNDVTVTEGDTGSTSAVFSVSLVGATALPATVAFGTADGTARAGADYTSAGGTLTFNPGTTSQLVTVAVLGDLLDEPDETFTVNLTAPTGATIADPQGTGTILDNDPAPELTIAGATVTEGNTGTTSALFAVTLSAPSGQTVTVDFDTSDNTATAPDDYAAASGTLTFAPGVTTQQIAVAVRGDTVFEPDENFIVELTNATNATIATDTVLGTIINDDLPTLTINDATVTEGNAGTTSAVFAVTLSGPSGFPATVSFATADATALAGIDYTTTAGTLSFAPGTTAQLITVPVLGDLVSEPTEAFNVNLSNATGATIADGQGVGTILDDDGVPALVINDITVAEGNAGTTSAVFTVSLSAASAQQITVGFATADGTATAGADYTAAAGTLTFAAGVTAQQITVPVLGDAIFEGTETFLVNLTSPVNATLADGQGVGTITNDDTAPTLAINDVTVTEGNVGTTNAVFTVTLTGATALPAAVAFATADGTAIAGSDYTATTGALTFAPGTTVQLITVPVLGDTLNETNETFFVNLSAPTNATILDAQGVGTIANDDGTPSLAVNDVTVTEGNAGTTNAIFTVSLSAASAQQVTVGFATADATATAGADYTATAGTLTFAPGATTQLITVPVLGDAVFEANETFLVNLSNPVNATLADADGVGTITNDDPAPTLAINDVTITEGNAGSTNAVFTVTLTGATALPTTVAFATADGTATAGSDYTATTGTLTFAPGTTAQPITVPVLGDAVFEANENFLVNLTSPVNATLADAQGVGTITNDDTAPTLAINDVTVTEGNAGTTNAVFTVTLTGATSFPATVAFTTADGTATAGSDYTATTGTLSFAPGTTAQLITVPVLGDTLNEPNETFFVNLSAPTNATILDAQGVGTIANDDGTPSLAVNDVTVTEGNAGTTSAVFTVNLSAASAQQVTVGFATADGTATAGSDYTATTGTLTFAPGTTTQLITVPVLGDVVFEANETFLVNLTSPINATLADAQGVGTITNDDTAPTLAINDVTVTEGNAGATNAVFTVTLTGATALPATVAFATADATAVAPGDYTQTSGVLSFAPGTTAQLITVPVVGDTLAEPTETFNVNLSNASGATIADGQGIGTILDNDTAPTLAINDVTVTEGNAGTTNAVFTVTLTGATALPATVAFATADGTATAGSDYTATTGTLTFAPGTTAQLITVPVLGDTLNEANETFLVNLSAPTNATILDAQGVGTIANDDGTPSLAVNDITVTEGNAGTANAVFTVSLSAASAQQVTVGFATADGTATAGSDYTATTGTLTFAPGSTAQLITVLVVGDTLAEPTETFTVTLSTPTGATIADGQGVGTILDNDGAPTLAINDVTVTEGNAGTINAVFTVSLSGATAFPATVAFATADDSATAGTDYTASTGTLTFAPGTTAQLITVPVRGDVVFEATESFLVNLTNPVNASVTDTQGVGTITNDDAPPSFTITNATVMEGDTGSVGAVFTVALAGATDLPATVKFATAGGTATAGADYTTVGGTLTFAPGTTSQLITVPVLGDTITEPTETFFVNLSDATAATIAGSQGVGTILDNEGLPTLSIADVTVVEGNAGTVNAVFTVSLAGATSLPATVVYATADNTATGGVDYTPTAGTLTISPLVGQARITVAVHGDLLDEDNESFFVNLSGATNALIGDPQAVGTITDDDPSPAFAINDVTVTEGNAGTTNAVFTVSLSTASGRSTSVDFATADGSAVSPGDYTGRAGTLTFAPGVTAQQLTIAVVGDLAAEPTETFNVNLSNAVNATIADNLGVGTIVDDDTAPAIAITDATVTEGNAGTTSAVFTVSLSTAAGQTVTVDYATANDTATAPGDYTAAAGTLTFTPGATARTFTVAVAGDTTFETNERFLVNLSNAVNATIADPQGIGTITNDDAPPTLAIGDVTVTEGDAGTTSAVFTVTLTGATEVAATVGFTTANGTALAGSDYAATTGTLSFAPGTTAQLITVAVLGDLLNEANETFAVNLAAPTNATLADAQGIGTIIDNDPAPLLTIADATVTEGNAGTTSALFTVTLSAPSGQTVTASFDTLDGSAIAPIDYAARAGTLTFAPGVTSQQIAIAVQGDTVFEADETFLVEINAAANATIDNSLALGTIVNDDAPPTLAINDVTVTEGNTGATNAVFTVTLTGATARPATVGFTTADATALAGSDYAATTGTLSFAPGTTAQLITVPVLGDTLSELTETFLVNLTSPVNATIADGQGVGTILDNDGVPALSINNVSVTEGNTGTTNAVFTVSLTAASAQQITVDFTTANGTATAPADYATTSGTLTFAAGTTTQAIVVPVVGDTLDEANETFTVTLSAPTNATIATAQGIGTIVDDDPAPTLAINDVTVTEGNAGITNAVFTVTLTGATALPATVAFATADGTATAGSDYTATTGTITFAPGTTAQLITVPVLGDTLNEANETFFVNLSAPTNATILDAQGVGTIANDDGTPSLAVNDVTVTEGNAGTTNAIFTVSLSAASAQQITVGFATADGTATAGSDYTATTGTLTFAPGTTTQLITVPVLGDAVFEANETFLVNLTSPVNATLADAQGVGTITNEDAAPTLTVNDVTVTEGNAGTTNAVFTVTLTGATALPATVAFATADGTATAGSDYTATAGTLTFAPGTTTQLITVPVLGDVIFEANETFLLNLGSPVNATLADGQGVGTITNDDTAPTFAINDVTVTEGNAGTTNAVFTVTLTGATAFPATVAFATADGTATAGSDYTAAAGTLTFAPGVTAQLLTVPVLGDTLNEANETFLVNLSAPTNATLADAQGVGTIANDDGTPSLAVNDVTVTEGNAGTTNAVFTVSLSAASAQQVTVGFATADGTATAGADYTAVVGTLTFAPGVTSQQFSVAVTGDTVFEANETFLVNLSNPVNATLADAQGVGTITNDDTAPTLAINDVTVTEGNAGTTNAVFTVTLTGATALPATVNFATANGTAVAPGDYTPTIGTLTFAPGTTTQLITVPVVGDVIFETSETFLVNLTNPVNATVADGQGVGTITDDDTAPTLAVNDVTVTEGNAGTTNAIFTVTLTGATALPATVNFTTTDGTATAGSDYTAATGTLTFAPGVAAQLITVPVLGDTLNEPNETFFVNLSAPTNATILDAQGIGTIANDDGPPSLAVNDVTVTEGNAGTTNAVFTVSLSAASAQQVTVGFATADGSATAGADYTAAAGTLTFAAGVTSQQLTVTVAGDAVFEANETFLVNLTNPVNATLADGQGVGTIANDDPAPTLAINDVTVTEGNAGTTNAVFTVTLTGATALQATANFTTANVTATAGSDYTATAGTLTFAPGTTAQLITVAVLGDTVFEPTETFQVNLTNPVNATLADAQGVGTITNDDLTPSLAVNDVTVTEGNAGTSNAVFTVSLSGVTAQQVTVGFATADGTATAGSDYTATAGTLTFAPGTTTQLITVPVLGDAVFETNETFLVNLTSPVNATILDGQGVGTITNDDTAPTLAINDVTVTEGNTGTTNAVFTVTLTGATALPATVAFATADGAATVGSDFTAATGTLTFAPGVTAQLITVPVLGDTVNEPNETFSVNLSVPTNATIADGQGIGTITNDDVAPAISINDVAVTEGNAGTTSAVFTVSLTAASAQQVTVGFATADGTATAGSDYTAAAGTLTFAAGVTAQQITVPVLGDAVFEATETFLLNLTNPVNATIADAQGVGTIANDDPAPTFAINDVTVIEGNAGTTNAVFTVTLTGATTLPATVNFATADNTASAGADYTTTSGTLTFAPGTTAQLVTVAVLGDVVAEPTETFFVNLTAPTNAAIADPQGVGTITDDDTVAALSINDVSVAEGDTGTTSAIFTVSLTAASSQTITVSFATADGTAVAPSDYIATTGSLTFAPGTTALPVTVPVVGDTINEPTETFSVNLSAPTNATIADAQGVGIITDTDPQPTLRIDDTTVNEGDTGLTPMVFTLKLSSPSGQVVAVNFTTINSSATAPSDFVAQTGTLTFAPGTSTQTLTIAVVGDGAVEPDESFNVSLSQPVNATFDNSQAIGRILNDDTRSLVINDVTAVEGDTGTSNAVFTVSLSEVAAVPVTVNYTTTNGTAVAPADYLAQVGTLTFAPGTTTQLITVPIVGDSAVESTESFTVNLSAPVNAVVDNSSATGRILDNDVRALSVSDATVIEGDVGTTDAVFTVTLSQAAPAPVSVNFATSNISALAGSDYVAQVGTLTFAPGTTVQAITVPVIGDGTPESVETFSVNLSQPVNAVIDNASGTGHILDDDTRTLSINDVDFGEGDIPNPLATQASLDNFSIVRNGAAFFADSFGDGVPPPSAPNFPDGTPASYAVQGTLDEANGRVVLNTAGAAITQGIGQPSPFIFERGLLLTNIDPTNLTDGLKNDDTFSVTGLFDLTVPGAKDEYYGIRLADYATGVPGNDIVNLAVRRAPTGTVRVDFFRLDQTTGLFTDIANTALDPNHAQISLTLSRNSLANSEITASFAYVDGGVAGPTTTFGPTTPIFTGENWTRAEFHFTTPAPVFTVTLSEAAAVPVTVNFTTSDSSATSPNDYLAQTGTLTFAPGVTVQNITVPIVGDSAPEATEQFFVTLSQPTNATIANGSGLGRILDDDTRLLSISDATAVEGDSGTSNMLFTINLSQAAIDPVTVAFATSNSTAVAPTDYTPLTGILTFAPGTTVQTITVPIVGDTAVESDEQFSVTLSQPVNATLADSTALGRILDNDTPGSRLVINDTTVVEGDTGTTNAAFRLTLSAPAASPVTASFTTANGSATAPGDYTTTAGSVTFAVGTTTQTITVPVVGDTAVESNESFTVTLSNVVNATLTDGTGSAIIFDDDTSRSLVINDVPIAEPDSGTTNAVFVVTMSQFSPNPVTVSFATSNSTATTPADYTATSGTLTFLAGSTVQTLTVPVVGDSAVESNEQFVVTLSNAVGASIGDASGVGTIVDNDGGRDLVVNDVSVVEGNTGTTNAVFTVSLSDAAAAPVTVNFATQNSTAVAPTDYTATTGTLTFAPGTTVQTITVPVLGDSTVENDEQFVVNLSAATNAVIADTQGIGTIYDDDASRALVIDAVVLAEGNSGTTNAVFTVTMSQTAAAPVTVNFATANNSATTPSDYTSVSGTLTFAPGVTVQTITVPVVGDAVVESNEFFAVTLSAPVNASLVGSQAFATIFDDDSTRRIVVDDTTVVEGDSGTTNAVFTLTLSQAVSSPVTVSFATADSTATAPTDYTATTGTVTFAPGTTTQTVTVPVVGDAAVEPNEFINLTLSAPVNATLTDGLAFATIFDDDARRQLSIADTSVLEGDTGTSSAVFTVTMSEPVSAPVTVHFATSDNSATAGTDYTATTGTLTFAAGTTVQTISVPVVGDGVPESNEFFLVTLTAPVNATIFDGSAFATIVDDDTARQVSIADTSVVEGNSGTTNAVFAVTLSQPVALPVTVNFATSNNTATAPTDYTATTGTVTFAPGTTAQAISVPVVGDTTVEPNEFFVVTLSAPTNASLGDSSAFATIVDDDGTRTLAINDVSVTEGDAGTTNAVFTVSLSAPTTQTVTVNFATTNSTATAPSDYTTTTGTLTFAPGATTQPITVPVVGDLVGEPTEAFFVNLSAPVNATLADPQGVATILDNDVQSVAALSIDDVTVVEGNSGTTDAVFTVTLGGPSAQTVTVNFATANSSAVAPTDYTTRNGTLTFAPGSTAQTVTVPVVGDEAVESTEQFLVNLSAPVNATIDDPTGVGRILDDDTRTISIGDTTVIEGDSGTTSAIFPLSLSDAALGPVTVHFAVVDGNATSPSDYQAQTGTVTFAPGATTQAITVAVVGDEVPEPTETFFVTLSAPVDASLADTSATGRILDNDTRSLTIQDTTVVEGDSGTSNALFTVTLSQPALGPVSVSFATSDSSAVAPTDYTATTGVVTFAPGTTVQTITVPVVGDEVPEGTEQFFVGLSAPVDATLDRTFAAGHIMDNDTRTILIHDVTVIEGDSGTTNAIFAVTLSQAALGPVTVHFATQNSSAVSGSDYAATLGTLTFAPGTTVQAITVPVIGDEAVESTEQFFVNLTAPVDATLDNTFATGRILDNDTRTLAIHDTTVIEGDSGTSNALFTVTLSQAALNPVTVSFATSNSSATAPSDYTGTTGSLTFAPGTTVQTIAVPVVGDEVPEGTEQFVVTLSAPVDATIDNAQAIGRILDNDTRILSIEDTTVIEGDSGTSNALFTVTLSQAAIGPVTVNFATTNSSATAPSDYTATNGTLTFAPGTTVQTITVPIVGDTTAEADEVFQVTLSAPVDATLDNGTAIGRILDNDGAPALPRLVIDDRTITEGDSGTRNLVFTVTMSAASASPVTVQFATSPSSATAPSDYTTTTGTLSFAPNVTVQTLTVPVIGDGAIENDESFLVNLTNPINATIADGQGIGTIYDDDASRQLFIDDAQVIEGDSGTSNLVFSVLMSRPVPQPVTVQFTTSNSNAIAPADYTTTSGLLTFAAGTTAQTLTVPVIGEQVSEGNENLVITLTNPTNAGLGDGSALGTILDDDSSRQLFVDDADILEGNSGTRNLVFTVTMSEAGPQPVTVQYATVDGSAEASSDYTRTSGALTFASGTTVQTITVPVLSDVVNESNESFTLLLSNPNNASLGDGGASGTIFDDDASRQLAITDANVVEGDSGTTNMVFTVLMTESAPQPVTVQFATADSSAASPADYTGQRGVLTFAPGVTVQTITVPVVGDAAVESNETFVVNLSNAGNAVLADTQAVGTIFDDDATRQLVVTDANVVEGNSGTRNLVFTVTLSQSAPAPVTVQFQTANSTATAGSDYTQTSGTLTFAPGTTVQTITVPVIGDSAVEGNEVLSLTLTNASNASLGDSQGLGTIVDDDASRVVVIDDARVLEGDNATKNMVFKLTMSQAAAAPVTVQFQTSNSSATAPADYAARNGTVTFAAGATTVTITVPIVGDQVSEATEVFVVTLSNAANATLADGSALGTIYDDDNR